MINVLKLYYCGAKQTTQSMNQTNSKSSKPKRLGLLYRRIARELKSDIESGIYADGSPFPSESSLQESYGVSRVTIRSALALLQEYGLVERRKGSGTVVRSQATHKVLGKLVDFHKEAEMMGRKPSTRVLSIASRKSRIRERLAFNIHPDEEVIELRRLRFLDNVPVVLQSSSHPRYVLDGVSEKDLHDFSLYDFLRREKAIVVREAEEVIEPFSIGPEEARLLDIEPGVAVILAHRTSYDITGRTVELATNLIRGDHYKFTFRLRSDEVDR